MLDPRYIREHWEEVEEHLRRRGQGVKLASFLQREERRLSLLKKTQEKKHERNAAAKKIGAAKQKQAQQQGVSRKEEAEKELFVDLKGLSKEIKVLDEELEKLHQEQHDFMLHLPNMLDERTPIGPDENANVCIREIGKPEKKDFAIKAHYELAGDDLDFSRASKISGARFALLSGDLALLERALGNFFVSQNVNRGFTEVSPPVMVSAESMTRTGHLPKFADEAFRMGAHFDNLYLISTSEIPLMNMHANEIIDSSLFPLRYTALSSCFRSEAGAAGRDTRGLMRLHEFKKVELVSICLPEQSENEHDYITAQAERLLQALGIPYRVVILCSGDIGFSARLCYDIEVWIPSEGKYREVSSISNCGDFQCRRAKIRYRDANNDGDIALAHSLNGSSLPLGRTMIALLENFQQADSSVRIPEVLRPFMDGREYILKSDT